MDPQTNLTNMWGGGMRGISDEDGLSCNPIVQRLYVADPP